MASATNQMDQTAVSDLQNLENLIVSVKSLESQYQKGIDNKKGDEKIDNTDKLMEYQTDFWNSHISCIDSCNQHFMEMHEHGSFEANECCKAIWDFCCLYNLYSRNIFNEWLATDVESRKLTIFLAICDVEKFRCDKCVNCSIDSGEE